MSFYRLLKFFVINVKNIRFKNFKKKKIIFLDSQQFNAFQDIVKLDINEIEILDTRLSLSESKFYFSPQLIIPFIKFFFIHKTYSVTYSYFCACIEIINPKFVIDPTKYGFLFDCIKYFKNIKFTVLIDATKKKYKPNIDGAQDYVFLLSKYIKKKNFSKFKNLTFFLLSKRDEDIFNDFGITKKTSGINFVIIGSIYADFAKEKYKNIKNRFDIIYVSQLQSFEDMPLFGIKKLKSTEIIFNFLNSLNKPKIAVLCRNFENTKDLKEEINLFKSKINHKVKFLYRKINNEKYSSLYSYKHIMQSKMLITVNSTLGWESLVFKKKLIFAFGDFLKYYRWSPKSIPEKKLWKWNLFKIKSKNECQKMYASLLKLNLTNYYTNNQKYFNYLIALDNKVKSFIFLRNYYK